MALTFRASGHRGDSWEGDAERKVYLTPPADPPPCTATNAAAADEGEAGDRLSESSGSLDIVPAAPGRLLGMLLSGALKNARTSATFLHQFTGFDITTI